MTRPAIRDPEATRTAIIKAAHRLFVEKGFADTAVSEIAREAGVTQSLIHHHFGSKQELWRQVGHSCLTEIAQTQQECLLQSHESPGAEGLSRMLRGMFAFLRTRPDLVRLSLWFALERPLIPLPEREHLQMAQRLRDHLITLQQSGAIRSDMRPEYIVVMIQGLLLQWMQVHEDMVPWMLYSELDPTRVTPEQMEQADAEYVDAALKVLVEGVGTRR